MARADSSHPRLLVLDDPLQRVNGVLLLPDLLLESVKTFEDHPHVDTDLVDILAVTIDMPGGVLNLLFVIIKGLLLCNDVGPEVCLQPIALKG